MKRSLFFGVLLSFSCALGVTADLYVLKPVADTMLREREPTNNLGGHTAFGVGGDTAGGRNRSLIRFDLSSVPSTSKVIHARLKLNATLAERDPDRGWPAQGQIWMFRALRSWSEGDKKGKWGQAAGLNGATWTYPDNPLQPWFGPGGEYTKDFSFYRSAEKSVSADGPVWISGGVMNGDLQTWLENPGENYGWFLYHQLDSWYETGAYGTRYVYSLVYFSSREDEANAPELWIYTGNPAAPVAFINGEFINDEVYGISRNANNSLVLETSYAGGAIYYTLDGSVPNPGAIRYRGSIAVKGGETVRAVAYSSDYKQGGVEMPVIRIHVLPDYQLAFSRTSGGNVYINGVPQNETSSLALASNTVVRLSADPLPGYVFSGWTGDISSTDPILEFRMTSNRAVQAKFTPVLPAISGQRIVGEWLLIKYKAEPSFTYRIQASSDLQRWQDLPAAAETSGEVEEIYRIDLSPGQKFYRLRASPK